MVPDSAGRVLVVGVWEIVGRASSCGKDGGSGGAPLDSKNNSDLYYFSSGILPTIDPLIAIVPGFHAHPGFVRVAREEECANIGFDFNLAPVAGPEFFNRAGGGLGTVGCLDVHIGMWSRIPPGRFGCGSVGDCSDGVKLGVPGACPWIPPLPILRPCSHVGSGGLPGLRVVRGFLGKWCYRISRVLT